MVELLVGAGAIALLLVLAKNTPPKGSAPTELPSVKGSPKHSTATAASGRQYDVWTWPPAAGVGIYCVVKARGAANWLSFTNNTELGTRTPAKTNVSDVIKDPAAAAQVLGLMRTDWML